MNDKKPSEAIDELAKEIAKKYPEGGVKFNGISFNVIISQIEAIGQYLDQSHENTTKQ